MKHLFLLLSVLLLSGHAYPQSKKELKQQIEQYKTALAIEQKRNSELTAANECLSLQIAAIRTFILHATEPTTIDSIAMNRTASAKAETTVPASADSEVSTQPSRSAQCAAITQRGTRCSRNAQSGSKYCWQHQNDSPAAATSSSGYSGGHTWHTGPRGGQYYINSKGNKVYKRKR